MVNLNRFKNQEVLSLSLSEMGTRRFCISQVTILKELLFYEEGGGWLKGPVTKGFGPLVGENPTNREKMALLECLGWRWPIRIT